MLVWLFLCYFENVDSIGNKLCSCAFPTRFQFHTFATHFFFASHEAILAALLLLFSASLTSRLFTLMSHHAWRLYIFNELCGILAFFPAHYPLCPRQTRCVSPPFQLHFRLLPARIAEQQTAAPPRAPVTRHVPRARRLVDSWPDVYPWSTIPVCCRATAGRRVSSISVTG